MSRHHSTQHNAARFISRRSFLAKSTAVAGAVALGVPALVRGRNLNEKLNIAVIGTGGRGGGNLPAWSRRISSPCATSTRPPSPRGRAASAGPKFADFRKLYDHASEFDAVVVSTTEHTHAFATLPALQLGKHVYCEKPLTHNVWEARVIREAAAKAKVATQMGTQIHAGDNYRRVVELIQTGAIGPVREVARLGVAGLGPAVEGSGRRSDRTSSTSESGPGRLARPPKGSTGTSGSARRPSGRSTTSISPGRNGIAGGISATAP